MNSYLTLRIKERFLDEFLEFIEKYLKSDNIPMDIFFDLERNHPQETTCLVEDYNNYFGYEFKDWESIIKFWRPDFYDPTPP
jgi:hypothetical protein